MEFYTFSLNGFVPFVGNNLKPLYESAKRYAESLGDDPNEFPSYSTVNNMLKKKPSYQKSFATGDSYLTRQYNFNRSPLV